MENDIKLMTKDELEKEQEMLHNNFEQSKEKCYEEYLKMQNFSQRYLEIEEELNKRNGKITNKNE